MVGVTVFVGVIVGVTGVVVIVGVTVGVTGVGVVVGVTVGVGEGHKWVATQEIQSVWNNDDV